MFLNYNFCYCFELPFKEIYNFIFKIMWQIHFRSETVYNTLLKLFYVFCFFFSGYVQTGSLCLAQNQDRFISLKRLASRLK